MISSSQKYAIGIDVGGTNTDACLIDSNGKLIQTAKVLTNHTALHIGIIEVIQNVLQIAAIQPCSITSVSIGTTHGLNAILEAKNLQPTALIRIASNTPKIRPGFGWDSKLRQVLLADSYTIQGGFECDGSEINPCCRHETQHVVRTLLEKGIRSFALVSTFGCLNNSHEIFVENLLREEACHFSAPLTITKSCDMGGIGFLERENATLLNSALSHVIAQAFQEVTTALTSMGITAPCCMVMNDGSASPIDVVSRFPILTVAAGQTNSGKGGMLLYQKHIDKDKPLLVIDIGGTSSDCIHVENGYIRRNIGELVINGVRMQFPAPDVLSIALGGGTIVHSKEKIGPESIAKRVLLDSASFGGNCVTLSDIAIQLGYLDLSHVPGFRKDVVSRDFAASIMESSASYIIDAIRLAKGRNIDCPVAFVGGGAPLLYEAISKKIDHVLPLAANFSSANALGAAFSERSGTIDTITSLQERKKTLDRISEEAVTLAIQRGACSSQTSVKNIQILPLSYSAQELYRVVITASGPKAQE